ncbi:hypothetical protein NUSPORA_02014 [Nucleospora cyclopteri]
MQLEEAEKQKAIILLNVKAKRECQAEIGHCSYKNLMRRVKKKNARNVPKVHLKAPSQSYFELIPSTLIMAQETVKSKFIKENCSILGKEWSYNVRPSFLIPVKNRKTLFMNFIYKSALFALSFFSYSRYFPRKTVKSDFSEGSQINLSNSQPLGTNITDNCDINVLFDSYPILEVSEKLIVKHNFPFNPINQKKVKVYIKNKNITEKHEK